MSLKNKFSPTTIFNVAYLGFLIRTSQRTPLCPFFSLEWGPIVMWWNGSITALISSPNAANDMAFLQIVGPSISSVTILDMFFALWIVSSHSGGKGKQPEGVCVRGWQQSITCQPDEAPLVQRRGQRRGKACHSSLIALSHLPLLSVSSSGYLALFDFYSPNSILQLTWITPLIKLTPGLQTLSSSWESHALLCHFARFLTPSYYPNTIHLWFPSSEGWPSMQWPCSNIKCKHAHMHIPVYRQPPQLRETQLRSVLRGSIKAKGLLQGRETTQQTGRVFLSQQ